MAQPLTCDICQAEPAVQMLTNVQTGDVMMIGIGCAPVFYGQSLSLVLDAGEHKSIPSKCQTCRRIHEHMTTPAVPIGVQYDDAVPGAQAEAPADVETADG